MKLALFHFGYMYSGGGERTSIAEAMYLSKRGVDVSTFSPAVRPDICHPDLMSQVRVRGFLPKVKAPIPLRDFMSLSMSSLLTPLFARLFADYDLILSHGQPATWIAYLVSRSLEKRYVCYLHQPARFLYPRQIDLQTGWRTKRDFALLNDIVRISKPVVSAFDHVSVTSAKRVLVNSKWISDWVRKIYNVNSTVCHPGVDVEKFVPVENRSDVRIDALLVKRPYILSTNRHYPQKGVEYLLGMMPQILVDCDVRLVLTGGFTRYTRIMAAVARKLGIERSVVFTDQVDEATLVKLYQNADVYAYMSPCEDFGLGPVEAMSCGTPPVVWDYAGPRETVDDGVTGFRAKAYDIEDFAERVLRLLGDEQLNRKMGKRGARHARATYSWDRHLAILIEVLEQVSETRRMTQ